VGYGVSSICGDDETEEGENRNTFRDTDEESGGDADEGAVHGSVIFDPVTLPRSRPPRPVRRPC
jgi:hypothetical protein